MEEYLSVKNDWNYKFLTFVNKRVYLKCWFVNFYVISSSLGTASLENTTSSVWKRRYLKSLKVWTTFFSPKSYSALKDDHELEKFQLKLKMHFKQVRNELFFKQVAKLSLRILWDLQTRKNSANHHASAN
jgi:hypothetical protein